jgi:ssDNA-binding Zn-finger/Zn-ribbon topoisomerase 1
MLRLGQYIYCINPKCKETWKVTEIEGEEASFETVTIDVPCRVCGAVQHIPWRVVTGMKYDQHLTFACSECEGTNFVKWHLMQATLPGSDGAEPTA